MKLEKLNEHGAKQELRTDEDKLSKNKNGEEETN